MCLANAWVSGAVVNSSIRASGASRVAIDSAASGATDCQPMARACGLQSTVEVFKADSMTSQPDELTSICILQAAAATKPNPLVHRLSHHQ